MSLYKGSIFLKRRRKRIPNVINTYELAEEIQKVKVSCKIATSRLYHLYCTKYKGQLPSPPGKK